MRPIYFAIALCAVLAVRPTKLIAAQASPRPMEQAQSPPAQPKEKSPGVQADELEASLKWERENGPLRDSIIEALTTTPAKEDQKAIKSLVYDIAEHFGVRTPRVLTAEAIQQMWDQSEARVRKLRQTQKTLDAAEARRQGKLPPAPLRVAPPTAGYDRPMSGDHSHQDGVARRQAERAAENESADDKARAEKAGREAQQRRDAEKKANDEKAAAEKKRADAEQKKKDADAKTKKEEEEKKKREEEEKKKREEEEKQKSVPVSAPAKPVNPDAAREQPDNSQPVAIDPCIAAKCPEDKKTQNLEGSPKVDPCIFAKCIKDDAGPDASPPKLDRCAYAKCLQPDTSPGTVVPGVKSQPPRVKFPAIPKPTKNTGPL